MKNRSVDRQCFIRIVDYAIQNSGWSKGEKMKIYMRYSFAFKNARVNALLFIFLSCLMFSCKLFTQDLNSDFHDLNNKEYYTSYLKDTRDIIVSPGSWKGRDWLLFGGVMATAATVYVFDSEIHDFAGRNNTSATEWISKYVAEPIGSGLYTIPLLGAFYAAGAIGNNNHNKNVALTGVKAFLLSGGAAFLAKHLSHRHRPSQDEPPDPYLWEGPFSGGWEYTSFPSGHTAVAFAVASVIGSGYKDKTWVGITSYTLASLVGLSRIYDNKHWPSDVFAGAVLGTYIGTFLGRKYLPGTRTGLTLNHGIPSIYLAYTID